MLKIHSFLHRMKTSLRKFFPQSIGKYKNQMVVVSYTMATVLVLISPDYIYGTKEGNTFVKAEITQYTGGITFSQNVSNELLPENIEEETDNEAIIRVNDHNANNIGQPVIQVQNYLDNELLNQMTAKMSKDQPDNDDSISLILAANNTDKTNEEISSKDTEPILEDKEGQEETTQKQDKKTEKKTDNEADKKTAKKEKDKDKADSDKKGADAKKADSSSAKKYVIELSKEEKEILQRIVEAEATGEDIKGKMLVANVVINRTKDKNFPDTVKDVVFQKSGGTYQFSPIKDKRYWSVKITEETITAVDRVMQGEDESNGALYFSARRRAEKNSMRWFDRNLKYLFTHGGHEFFKNK